MEIRLRVVGDAGLEARENRWFLWYGKEERATWRDARIVYRSLKSGRVNGAIALIARQKIKIVAVVVTACENDRKKYRLPPLTT